jgi:hypothetical protein
MHVRLSIHSINIPILYRSENPGLVGSLCSILSSDYFWERGTGLTGCDKDLGVAPQILEKNRLCDRDLRRLKEQLFQSIEKMRWCQTVKRNGIKTMRPHHSVQVWASVCLP